MLACHLTHVMWDEMNVCGLAACSPSRFSWYTNFSHGFIFAFQDMMLVTLHLSHAPPAAVRLSAPDSRVSRSRRHLARNQTHIHTYRRVPKVDGTQSFKLTQAPSWLVHRKSDEFTHSSVSCLLHGQCSFTRTRSEASHAAGGTCAEASALLFVQMPKLKPDSNAVLTAHWSACLQVCVLTGSLENLERRRTKKTAHWKQDWS